MDSQSHQLPKQAEAGTEVDVENKMENEETEEKIVDIIHEDPLLLENEEVYMHTRKH